MCVCVCLFLFICLFLSPAATVRVFSCLSLYALLMFFLNLCQKTCVPLWLVCFITPTGTASLGVSFLHFIHKVTLLTHSRVCLHNSDVLKREMFYLYVFEKFCVQTTTTPVQTDPQLQYYAWQASSWQCHFVKKHFMPAHIDWTQNTHANNVTVLTNVCFL